jgi:hypothetical protein
MGELAPGPAPPPAFKRPSAPLLFLSPPFPNHHAGPGMARPPLGAAYGTQNAQRPAAPRRPARPARAPPQVAPAPAARARAPARGPAPQPPMAQRERARPPDRPHFESAPRARAALVALPPTAPALPPHPIRSRGSRAPRGRRGGTGGGRRRRAPRGLHRPPARRAARPPLSLSRPLQQLPPRTTPTVLCAGAAHTSACGLATPM